MKVTITEKKDEPMLSRTKVRGTVEFQGATPSNADVAKTLAKNIKADEKLVVVKEITKKFGTQSTPFRAVAYTKAEDMYRIEGMEQPKEEPKEEASEAKADEKPTEEKKEDAPAEEAKKEDSSEKKDAPAEKADEKSGSKESSEEKPAEEKKE